MKSLTKIFLIALILCIFPTSCSLQSNLNLAKHIFYDPGYNITVPFGLEKLVPFDTLKYGKVAQYIANKLTISEKDFSHPTSEIDNETLAKVHTQKYLEKIKNKPTEVVVHALDLQAFPVLGTTFFGKCAEWILNFIPNNIIDSKVLKPMRLATQGTVQATQFALTHGWAINLSGGYHHAKANESGGYCVYADIPLALTIAIEDYHIERALVIDLDAHQGNGHEDFFAKPGSIFADKISVFDIYGKDNYPFAQEHKIIVNKPWAFDFGLTRNQRTDDYYKTILNNHLENAIKVTKPQLIIYNAGTDIYKGDPEGMMNISKGIIIQRDALVFSLALAHKIPIVMLLSGGYTKESANIISKSVENIIDNIIEKKEYIYSINY